MLLSAVFIAIVCVASIGCNEEPEYVRKGDILIEKDKSRGVLVKGRPWPSATMIYDFESGYRREDIDLIMSAMSYISSVSCVRFKRRTNEAAYVAFRPGAGCNAILGYTGRYQFITLQTPGCIHKGVIMHEIMHALGWDHEQNRYDRDNYVHILYDNIQAEYQFAFSKVPRENSDLQGQPYDCRSIMHYPWNAFAVNPRSPTIISKQSECPPSALGIGYSESYMTAIDIRKINMYYKCR